MEAIALAAETAQAEGALLISNIGFPSRELYAAKDRPLNFYMLGSMGLASSIGLGLALGQAQGLPARRFSAHEPGNSGHHRPLCTGELPAGDSGQLLLRLHRLPAHLHSPGH